MASLDIFGDTEESSRESPSRTVKGLKEPRSNYLQGLSFTQTREDSLSNEEIHSILNNSRRQATINQLLNNGGQMSVRDLSEWIAEGEAGASPAPRETRQSVYISLVQTHLPKMADFGVIDYDTQSKHVAVKDSMMEVTKFMDDAPPEYNLLSGYLAVIWVIGIVLVFLSDNGWEIVSAVSPIHWAYLFFLIGILMIGFQNIRIRRFADQSPTAER